MSGRFFLLQLYLFYNHRDYKKNNNNKHRAYLTGNYFDYTKGNEGKDVYGKKSGYGNLKSKGPVPGR